MESKFQNNEDFLQLHHDVILGNETWRVTKIKRFTRLKKKFYADIPKTSSVRKTGINS